VSYLKPKQTDNSKLVPTAAWAKSRNMSTGIVNNTRAEFILKRMDSSRAETHFDGISGVEAFQKLRSSAQLRMSSD
jgi:hypothetical protein